MQERQVSELQLGPLIFLNVVSKQEIVYRVNMYNIYIRDSRICAIRSLCKPNITVYFIIIIIITIIIISWHKFTDPWWSRSKKHKK